MIRFEDYLGLKTLLTDEEQEILRTFLKFSESIEKEIEDSAWNRKPADKLWDRMAGLGVFGAHIPEIYGGIELPNVAYGLMMLGLEAGDSSLRSAASVQNALVCYPILTFGSKSQKETWLPRLAAGAMIGAFGLTEPDHGSNPGGMVTRAEVCPGGFRLNGAKSWITNADIADLNVIWAKLDGKVHGFLVEKGTPGLSANPMKRKDSLEAGHTGEIILRDVEIPESAILPDTKGLASPLSCLNEARYGIAWGVIGAAMSAYATALDYTKERPQFNKPLASFQLVQAKLADMISQITASLSLVLHLGRLRDLGEIRFPQVSMAKRMNCRMAREVAMTARDLLGANGVSAEYPIMRIMKNIESVYTYEGTDHMHTLIIGHHVTGIPAYRS